MSSVSIVTSSPDSARAAATRGPSSFSEIEEQNKSLKARQDAQREKALLSNPSQSRGRSKRRAANEAKAQLDAAAAKAAAQAKATGGKKGKSLEPLKLPDKYQWNLPPHLWSKPVRAIDMHPDLYTEPGTWGQAMGPGMVPEEYRRGRIWWYFNTNNTYKDAAGKEIFQTNGFDRRIGFQFMWNPETFSTSVQLNTEITPSPADIFASVAGAFPSGETLTVQVRLDRTNDFACMRHLLKKDFSLTLDNSSKETKVYEEMAKYYQTSFSSTETAEAISKKIRDLMDLGTVADLEYLYKAINGPYWKSITGRSTADIGYLSATLLRVDIGPLSYVGYVNNLTVNHISFAQDMTPMRTDVSIAMNLMASAGIASDGRAAAVAPTK